MGKAVKFLQRLINAFFSIKHEAQGWALWHLDVKEQNIMIKLIEGELIPVFLDWANCAVIHSKSGVVTRADLAVGMDTMMARFNHYLADVRAKIYDDLTRLM